MSDFFAFFLAAICRHRRGSSDSRRIKSAQRILGKTIAWRSEPVNFCESKKEGVQPRLHGKFNP